MKEIIISNFLTGKKYPKNLRANITVGQTVGQTEIERKSRNIG